MPFVNHASDCYPNPTRLKYPTNVDLPLFSYSVWAGSYIFHGCFLLSVGSCWLSRSAVQSHVCHCGFWKTCNWIAWRSNDHSQYFSASGRGRRWQSSKCTLSSQLASSRPLCSSSGFPVFFYLFIHFSSFTAFYRTGIVACCAALLWQSRQVAVHTVANHRDTHLYLWHHQALP